MSSAANGNSPFINSICNGNKRFREIERSIPGIIRRTQDPNSPQKVEYESTGYCYSFGNINLEMKKSPMNLLNGDKFADK